jgi:hypothetical protein
MRQSALFVVPILFFGIGTIFGVQEALEFRDPMRDMLIAVLLIATLVADDTYGPRAAQREREGRR